MKKNFHIKVFGEKIEIKKELSGWNSKVKNIYIIMNCQTKEECKEKTIEIINSSGEIKFKDAIKKVIKRRITTKLFKKFSPILGKIMKVDIPADRTIYMIFGAYCLDTIRLNSLLRVPDYVSTKDFIFQNFGSKVLKMIEMII